MENDTRVWDKTQDELTVGDAVKIQLVAMGALVGIYAAAWGGTYAVMKFHERRNRKMYGQHAFN